eukprot:10866338-Alexandrium_andersonii.AAC.1
MVPPAEEAGVSRHPAITAVRNHGRGVGYIAITLRAALAPGFDPACAKSLHNRQHARGQHDVDQITS